MKRKLVFAAMAVLMGGVGLASATASISAAPQTALACCNGPGDCDSGKCCEPDVVGMPACTPDLPGYCASSCPPRRH
jgi:hypothetical protein